MNALSIFYQFISQERDYVTQHKRDERVVIFIWLLKCVSHIILYSFAIYGGLCAMIFTQLAETNINEASQLLIKNLFLDHLTGYLAIGGLIEFTYQLYRFNQYLPIIKSIQGDDL